jgi:hypothetical protein
MVFGQRLFVTASQSVVLGSPFAWLLVDESLAPPPAAAN